MSSHPDMAAVLAELQALRAEVAELRKALAETESWVRETCDHVVYLRNVIDTSDL